MPWKRMHVDEERMRFVVRAVSGQERMAALCREFGISRPTGYLWRQRYRKSRSLADLVGAQPASATQSRAHGRVESGARGGLAAADRLGRQEIASAAARGTAAGFAGAHHPPHSGTSRTARRPQSWCGAAAFQRSTPNELWQMDTKGKYPLRDGQCHALSILDDHSRYAVGLYALPQLTAAQALSLLGADLSPLWRAAGHVNGSWLVVVGDDQRMGIDLAVAAADRTRDSLAVRAGVASADAGESGTFSSHPGRNVAASRSAGANCGLAWGPGGISSAVTTSGAARSAGDAAACGTLPAERAPLSGTGAALGISGGQRGAAIEWSRES